MRRLISLPGAGERKIPDKQSLAGTERDRRVAWKISAFKQKKFQKMS